MQELRKLKDTNIAKGVARRLRLLRSKLQRWHKEVTNKAKNLKVKLQRKQRLVVMDAETYRERWSYRLSAQNLFVGIGIVVIILMVLIFLLIAFTPLHNLIPGYTNGEMIEQTYRNMNTLDSLETKVNNQEQMMAVLSSMVAGEEMGEQVVEDTVTQQKVSGKPDRRNKADSLLRDEIESARPANTPTTDVEVSQSSLGQLFFSPIKGKILHAYDIKTGHYGVDIAGNANEIIKAAGNGTVSFSGFTVDDGYVIVIQHPGNIITIYKHNSTLLKRVGDMVRAGEPIAHLGNTGEHRSVPHLHFELWINGKAVNPLSYVSF